MTLFFSSPLIITANTAQNSSVGFVSKQFDERRIASEIPDSRRMWYRSSYVNTCRPVKRRARSSWYCCDNNPVSYPRLSMRVLVYAGLNLGQVGKLVARGAIIFVVVALQGRKEQ